MLAAIILYNTTEMMSDKCDLLDYQKTSPLEFPVCPFIGVIIMHLFTAKLTSQYLNVNVNSYIDKTSEPPFYT